MDGNRRGKLKKKYIFGKPDENVPLEDASGKVRALPPPKKKNWDSVKWFSVSQYTGLLLVLVKMFLKFCVSKKSGNFLTI